MKFIMILSLVISSLFTSLSDAQPDSLRTEIGRYLDSKDARVGVAISHFANGDTLSFGNQAHYPMQSVFKFHLALAVLHQVDEGTLALDQNIPIRKGDLLVNTWSPIQKKYPEGNVELPLSEILRYTVSQSDNSGCDILFRLLGGPERVNEYIHQLGVDEVAITATEQEMHQAWEVQYSNWTTPQAAVELLQQFYQGDILSDDSRQFLWRLMVETTTGPRRIKGQLPEGTTVAHKTGTSGTNEQGIMAATNDIGIMLLPDGEAVGLAVLVSDSPEDEEANQRIIADIARMVWDYYQRRH
jgi:beta-lactamase class A